MRLRVERDRPLDTRPRACRRLPQVERSGDAPDLAEVVDELPAFGAAGKVSVGPGPRRGVERSVDVIRDDVFFEVHGYFNKARSFIRALNTCDFDVPSAMPSRSATSL